ncbi:5,10-methylenetetrahydrofolate reductase [Chloroherpeton thalassium ATCC 35110]|uniref:Methylenetetrahydrofolate reductase n=1 Tax=Chloroherpeton thalassium (strain ATCC 35110 / GB-78) TaxID=517418 RepID=B3QV58_CHLT3|nr:methylenetetrahydrofolate reductase [NAD(P)H] [Chloroherpeton thalassium]ACF13012.1 5,10-methylenetetrahydrofolate reductase [Chloroherpeton thalassium ATCC 35110]
MIIKDLLQPDKTQFSFEFYPPKKDEEWEKLFFHISELMPMNPAYVSVTYGAGGSTRDKTHNLVVRISKETNIPVVSHLTCVGSSKSEIHTILERYAENGITNILALRGDPPKGSTTFEKPADGFAYANELVAFIKKNFPQIGVGVAGFPEGHPETLNRLTEIDHLKEKVDAGADYIVTQLFFENRDFYDFRERCEIAGIHVPICAGIMPITTDKGMQRMAELSPGTRFPAPLLREISKAQNDEEVSAIGLNWAIAQVRDLIENKTPNIHLYTLNHSRPTLKIFEALSEKNPISS